MTAAEGGDCATEHDERTTIVLVSQALLQVGAVKGRYLLSFAHPMCW